MKHKFTFALTAIFALCASSVFAAPHFWVDTTGNWNTGANWTPATVPTAGENATIGDNGAGHALTGTADVHTGANAAARNLFLGAESGTSGTVNVFNTRNLNVAHNATVGDGGMGLMTVRDGSKITITDDLFVGNQASSQGTVDVTGTFVKGSNDFNLTANRDMFIGNSGPALSTLDIHNGGRAAVGRNAFIGNNAGSNGLVIVGSDGPNSESYWFIQNNLTVGNAGTGELRIRNGGFAGTFLGGNVFVGEQVDSVGRVSVDGSGAIDGSSLLQVGKNLVVGDAGRGRLDITDSALVTVAGHMRIGNQATGVGLVNVDGTGATLGNPSELQITPVIGTGNLTVGYLGKGTLNITNGGEVDPHNFYVARFGGSVGFTLIDGSNAFNSSTLTVTHNAFIGGRLAGPGGKGELDITNTGTLNVGNNMTVWGPGSDGRAVFAIDHTYNLTIGGQLFYQGGILRFLDNQVDFTFYNAAQTPVFLGTATGPIGMVVDTNGFFNIVGPGQSGFPRISALLTGPGGLTVRGGGDVFLTNDNTYTGLTHVTDNSFLFIDGSVLGNARVDAGSFLGGKFDGNAANVGGNLVVNGTFSPGDIIAHGGPGGDPQLFAVFGNASFNAGSTYVAEVGNVDIGPFPQPGSDLLVTLGSTTIDPTNSTIIVPRLDSFEPLPTEFLGGPPNGLAGEASETTVILAVGGRTGQFGTLIPENWPGLIQPAQDTDEPFVLEIKYVLHPFTSVGGLCDNELSVAEALDTAVAELPIRAIAFLGFTPVADLPQVFELIAPEEYASMYEMSFSHAITMDNSLQRHMDDIHAGASGYCGPVVEVNPPPIQDKNTVDSKKQVAPAYVPSPENRWSIWIQGNGDFVDVHNKDECAHGYNIDNGSVTMGVDYRIMHNLAIGVYGGYLGSNADLVNRGSINMAQGNVGGYATFSWNGFYLDASGGGGWSNYNTHRFGLQAFDPVLGLDFGPFANGQTDGSEVNAMGAIGYDWHFDTGKLGCLNIGPLVSVQYTDVNLNGFTERGSLLPLEFPDQNEDSVRVTAGGRASFDIKASSNGIILRPEVRASWLHECNDQEYPIRARFAFAPASPTFTVDGPRIGSDGALVGAGMTVVFNPSFGIFAFYDGVFGRTNYDLNSATGGFRLSF